MTGGGLLLPRFGCMAGAANWPGTGGASKPCWPSTCWIFCPRPRMKSGLKFETHSDEETQALGRQLAKMLPDRGVILLIGELGAGKTTLAKGIVEGRGVARAEDVPSPTFTLI